MWLWTTGNTKCSTLSFTSAPVSMINVLLKSLNELQLFTKFLCIFLQCQMLSRARRGWLRSRRGYVFRCGSVFKFLIQILLTGSNNQFWNYESWVFTNFYAFFFNVKCFLEQEGASCVAQRAGLLDVVQFSSFPSIYYRLRTWQQPIFKSESTKLLWFSTS